MTQSRKSSNPVITRLRAFVAAWLVMEASPDMEAADYEARVHETRLSPGLSLLLILLGALLCWSAVLVLAGVL
ncbi:hypothetical protein [Novosphingobium sp.]|uniref:hypothetical protein n=1 Tax=Novosphingobium sp. TaxID=1874826 RepID=UPI002608D338|nr:hypothetical protein [Novosphingobium sp.]